MLMLFQDDSLIVQNSTFVRWDWSMEYKGGSLKRANILYTILLEKKMEKNIEL